jgi:CheY-like chemotaxis protein
VRKTLLLADDSLTVRRVIEQTFADEPVDVVTVGDGAAVLARLEGHPPDVLLADIRMPGPDGYELALHVRRTPALAHIPVILLTGAFDPVDHARAREAGCAGVLVKPFDPQMLIARVRQLLEARRHPSGAADDATVRNASPEGGPIEDLEPALPHSSAASRAAEVDDYFDRLDRAFAGLQAPVEGDHRRDVPTGPEGDRGESASQVAPPAATAAPVINRGALGSAAPTLAGAFAALLAIEQGQPLPPAASGWTAAPGGDVVEQMVRRVTQEIAEAVIRDLAPGIVADVAERVVREQTARLTSTLPPR